MIYIQALFRQQKISLNSFYLIFAMRFDSKEKYFILQGQ